MEHSHSLRVDLSQEGSVEVGTVGGCRQDLKDVGLHLGPKVFGQVLVCSQDVQVQGRKDEGREALEAVSVRVVLEVLQFGEGADARAVRVLQQGTHLLLVLVVAQGKRRARMVGSGGDQRTDVLEQANALLGQCNERVLGGSVFFGVRQDLSSSFLMALSLVSITVVASGIAAQHSAVMTGKRDHSSLALVSGKTMSDTPAEWQEWSSSAQW